MNNVRQCLKAVFGGLIFMIWLPCFFLIMALGTLGLCLLDLMRKQTRRTAARLRGERLAPAYEPQHFDMPYMEVDADGFVLPPEERTPSVVRSSSPPALAVLPALALAPASAAVSPLRAAPKLRLVHSAASEQKVLQFPVSKLARLRLQERQQGLLNPGLVRSSSNVVVLSHHRASAKR